MRKIPANRLSESNVQLMDILGTPYIGLFAVVSEEFLIVSKLVSSSKIRMIEDFLGVEAITTSVCGTHLLGPMIVMNSSGILLPPIVLEEELEAIKKVARDLNVAVLESRFTALGNLIATNNKGAIASPEFGAAELSKISDVLGVEVLKTSIASRSYVGSICLLTDRGGLIHIDASDEDLKNVEKICHVSIVRSTVNDGVKYVRSGVLANTKGVLIGARTNGPELMTISRGLGL
ncbi:MAG: translation initiation factor IF-6 [Nitrososphaerota archaeon]